MAELITKSARGQVSVVQRTLAYAIEAGLRQAELEGLQPTTLRGYRTSADCHVLAALGSRRLSHLSAEHEVNPTLATLVVLAADTGSRWGELCALRWRHLDEVAATLRIEAAIGETNVVYEKDTKTYQHRSVALSSFALEWLPDHRVRHAKVCACAASSSVRTRSYSLLNQAVLSRCAP